MKEINLEGFSMNSFKRLLFTCLIVSFPVFADVDTTSSMRGNVNVSGAEVSVTYEPTGATKTTTASDNGNFSLSFLPVGLLVRTKVKSFRYHLQ